MYRRTPVFSYCSVFYVSCWNDHEQVVAITRIENFAMSAVSFSLRAVVGMRNALSVIVILKGIKSFCRALSGIVHEGSK